MVTYFDTSFILSFIFKERKTEFFNKYFQTSEYKISSIILDIEVNLNINKYIKENEINDLEKDKLNLISKNILDSINYLNINDEILNIIKNNDIFTKSKSLDAVHLATALNISNYLDAKLLILSFDKKMNDLAKDLGFIIIEN